MKSHEQQELRVLLAALDSSERRDLYKLAARRRQELQSKTGGRKPGPRLIMRDPEDLETAGNSGFSQTSAPGRKLPTLEEILHGLLKQRVSHGQTPSGTQPRVVGIGPGICQVETAEGIKECRLHHDLRCQQQTALAVGDLVELAGDRIRRVLPRHNRLSRPEPGNPHRERVMAANIDLAVIVVSCLRPALHPGLIDRILVMLEERHIPALICVNKIDLCATSEEREIELARLTPFKDLGIGVFPVSASRGDGIEELREAMSEKIGVFLGHSGVGKSSLINALSGVIEPKTIEPVEVRTGAVRASDGRGRHTTTGSWLHRLPHRLAVIDTPGVREFGLSDVTPENLADLFPEFRRFSSGCRFRDCCHLEEPDCAIREAVRDERISRQRYQRYRRILGSLRPDVPVLEFTCIGCGATVPLLAVGTTQRNHCPFCLWSRHLDQVPGDRSAACNGSMEPISVWVRKGGEWAIVHRCSSCGVIHANRVAGDDNEIKLLSLAVKPLSQPPFPLDRLGHPEERS